MAGSGSTLPFSKETQQVVTVKPFDFLESLVHLSLPDLFGRRSLSGDAGEIAGPPLSGEQVPGHWTRLAKKLALVET